MARIELVGVTHRYQPDEAAVAEIDLVFEPGGAYALLGPSGCGKTTLLGIVSGLLAPTEGKVLFDGKDVTTLVPRQRNIAQVFQLPVVYEAMTVRQNLAFPLRNRGVEGATVKRRVERMADLLELDQVLGERAAVLPADLRQRVCLGRGLVREDVAAVLLDEPMTAIDPHQRWRLRRTLKQVHESLEVTLIYVTHDQEEALTFADSVVVLDQGRVLQESSPEQLFARPRHAFVGTFIGSPGMNLLPCEIGANGIEIGGVEIVVDPRMIEAARGRGALELGIRPECLRLVEIGTPARVEAVRDLGTHHLAELSLGGQRLLLRCDAAVSCGNVQIDFPIAKTFLYADSVLIG